MKKNPDPIEKAAEFIRNYRSFVAASHLNPEGDAIGALLGIKYLIESAGKTCHLYNADPLPPNTAFLTGASAITRNIEEVPKVEAAIVLDCGDRERPGADFAAFAQQLPVLNIDHHPTNAGFGDVNWIVPGASSVGEMIVNLASHMDINVSAEAALALYTAILTDTGSFQYNNTTPEALQAAAQMVRAGARPDLAARNYYHNIPAQNLVLLARCLQTLEFNNDKTRADMTLTSEMFRQTGAGAEAAEGFVNYMTDVATVKVAVLIRQTGEREWKISMRSKGEIDVAELATRHQGGGHRNAAGCRLEGSQEEVKSLIRTEIEEEIDRIKKSAADPENQG